MKKLVLVMVCVLSTLAVSAQRASSSSSSFFSTEKASDGVRFGVRTGLNFANISGKDMVDTDMRTSFHVGVIADIPLMQSLYIQTGLYVTEKGWKYEENYYYKWEEKYNPMYLEIPILASYRYNFNDATQLQFNVGPYLAYGIGGSGKYEKTDDGGTDSYECDFFGKESEDKEGGKRFDYGLQIGLGFTFAKHYYVGCAYEFGLTKIADWETKPKNNNWMISLGYTF